jgi:hypothetical protein
VISRAAWVAALLGAALAAPGPAGAESLRLVGTAVGAKALAVFEAGEGRQVLRGVGDTLGPGIRIARIGHGEVEVVTGDGRRATIRARGSALAPVAGGDADAGVSESPGEGMVTVAADAVMPGPEEGGEGFAPVEYGLDDEGPALPLSKPHGAPGFRATGR